MKTSIVLPTYNEKENIENLINAILKYVKTDIEIIVIDDNSPDRTWDIVRKIGKKDPRIKLILRTKEKGVASAIQDGIKASVGDFVIWMDCDFSHPPELIPELLSALKYYDVAIASRYVDNAKDARDNVRIITSRMFNLAAQIILSRKVKDYTTGFVAAKRSVVEQVRFSGEGHGAYCVEFLYKAIRRGFKIKEVPYLSMDRKMGKSKTSQFMHISLIKHAFKYMKKVLSLRFNRKIK